ncbi:MAG: YdcF family protein, partial [Anaerolineaceae bacterium]|nr:YdcF family protein [Anaerolineaceae bacterium]
ALYSAEILNERGVEEIILVTSASHMLRSVALFEKQGFKVIPAPTDYSITYDQWNALWKPTLQDLLVGLVPNAGHLSDVTYVLKEYIGFVVYRVRGWL